MRLDQIRELDTTGSNELLRKILQAFLESAEGYIMQLEQAISQGAALKSSSGNIGAEVLSGIFRQPETDGRTGDLTHAKILQESLRQHYRQTIAETRQILNPS